MPRTDPLRNFRFRLEIDGIAQAAFSEVAIGEVTTEAIDYREGSDPMHLRKPPGLTRCPNIRLKRGITESLDIWNWHKEVAAGQIVANRKQVIIVAQDEAGTDKARFVVSEAWPAKYDASLNGKGNEVFIELLELVNEGIERVA